MKGLIEKMHESMLKNYEAGNPLDEYAADCYLISTEHFAEKWIKVEDKLPEREIKVLVYYYPPHPLMEGRVISISDRMDISGTLLSKQSNYIENESFNNGFRCMGTVTHWMPLPEPPKQ